MKSEIGNTRITEYLRGGYPLTYMAGGNFPELLICEYFMGESVEYFDDWKDGMLMLRYDDAIYVKA